MDRQRILFVIPVFQSVYPQPLERFMAMCLHAGAKEHERYEISPWIIPRTILHSAMNQAAAAAIDHGFEYLLFGDDDCLPPIDAIPRLLRHMEAGHEFVAGIGYMRQIPHTTTIGRYDPAGPTVHIDQYGAMRLAGFRWLDNVDDEPADLVPCDFCGFPIAMVSVAALKRFERPWFGTRTAVGDCTHDVFFGEQARAAGLSILVDRTIQCGHLSDGYVITDGVRRTVQHALRARADAAVEH